jgi:hypothetical protein
MVVWPFYLLAAIFWSYGFFREASAPIERA